MTDFNIIVKNEVTVSMSRVVLYLLDIVKKGGVTKFLDDINNLNLVIFTEERGVTIAAVPACGCENCTKITEIIKNGLRQNLTEEQLYAQLTEAAVKLNGICPQLKKEEE